MTDNDRELRSAKMHAEVAALLQNDPEARHQAEYSTDAASMVTALVPRRNREIFDVHAWLDRIVAMWAFADLPDFDRRDPVFITERDGRSYLVPEDPRDLPAAPIAGYCAHCQDWDASNLRNGVERSSRVQAVEAVRLARGTRVVELLLCGKCVALFGVEPEGSHG
jgi:hypothetical protein